MRRAGLGEVDGVVRVAELDVGRDGAVEDVAALPLILLEEEVLEAPAIELIARDAGEAARPQLVAVPDVAVPAVVEEIADAELRQLLVGHVGVQPQHLAEVVGADLDARFADLVGRFRGRVGALLEHQHLEAGPFLPELPREREAGQPPAEDDDVVVCLHARWPA